jgi:Rps23 Pro-64 3,4-dihydroxylase Tpa1-like proline 4-hydroxylase
MGRGDFLLPHDDNSRGRKLAVVIYLTPGWDPKFGGGLRVVDENRVATSIDATFNSIVIFDVAARTTHAVEPIADLAGEGRRLTIGGWYH